MFINNSFDLSMESSIVCPDEWNCNRECSRACRERDKTEIGTVLEM